MIEEQYLERIQILTRLASFVLSDQTKMLSCEGVPEGEKIKCYFQVNSPNQWVRLEIPSEKVHAHNFSYLSYELSFAGLVEARLQAVYLIFRPSNSDAEEAYKISSDFKLLGGFDRVSGCIKLSERCKIDGSWHIGVQASSSCEVTVGVDFLVLLDDIANISPLALEFPLRIEDISPIVSTNAPKRASIIICVHNALEASIECISRVLRTLSDQDELIVVNDGSHAGNTDRIWQFIRSVERSCIYVECQYGSGYTKAANRGLRLASGKFIIMLNSDAFVPTGWVEKLLGPMLSDDRISITGPLSNRATLQSIPNLEEDGTWATNTTVKLEDLELWNQRLERISLVTGQKAAPVLLINGFCMAVRRTLFEKIGGFDNHSFSTGYGEETDFQMRATAIGKTCAICLDLLVFHLGSSSYDKLNLQNYQDAAFQSVLLKHGQSAILSAYWATRHTVERLPLRSFLTRIQFDDQTLLGETK